MLVFGSSVLRCPHRDLAGSTKHVFAQLGMLWSCLLELDFVSMQIIFGETPLCDKFGRVHVFSCCEVFSVEYVWHQFEDQ